MPILPSEPEVFPDQLFQEPQLRVVGGDQRFWVVFHTRPRQEKSLARYLYDRQIPYYLPQTTRYQRIRNRLQTSHIPLFAGYLFALGTAEERVLSLASGRVAHSLTVANQEGLWHDLKQLQQLIGLGFPITPEERLAPGMHVEVQSGPLVGLRGTIIRGISGRRFVVAIDFLQQGASILLDGSLLSPVQPLGQMLPNEN